MERNKSVKRWTLLSLFAGAGGLDLGFRGGFTFLGKEYPRTPFDIVKAYDINPHAVATYNANLEPVCEVKDVTTLNPNDLPKADVVLGGFPCQDFSLAGKRQGINVHRGNLYKALVSAVETVRPKVFLAENVKGLLTANEGLAIRVIANDFAKAGPGYRIHMALLNAAHFGVPQRRERVFIVGVRKDLEGEFLFPRPTHAPPLLADGANLLPWVTAQDALHDLEDDRNLRLLPNWEWSKARKNRGQGNRPIRADEPAPTIRAEHHGNFRIPLCPAPQALRPGGRPPPVLPRHLRLPRLHVRGLQARGQRRPPSPRLAPGGCGGGVPRQGGLPRRRARGALPIATPPANQKPSPVGLPSL
jgi:DNA (cytosine-5)-methyltransferase 1